LFIWFFPFLVCCTEKNLETLGIVIIVTAHFYDFIFSSVLFSLVRGPESLFKCRIIFFSFQNEQGVVNFYK
jgi:hypothetical protein